MTTHHSTHPFAASLPFVAIASLAVAAAAQTPRPTRAPEPAHAPAAAPATPAAPVAPLTATATAPTAAPVAASAPTTGVTSATPATPASLAPTAAAVPRAPSAEIPVAVLREWIQQHHPNVIAGDPSVNEVVIVVDANEQYRRSYARFDSTPGMNAGGMRGRVGGGGAIATSVGRIGGTGRGAGYIGDTTAIKFEALAGALPTDRPLIIVDGVVVNGVDGIERDRIHSVEVIKGVGAIAKYGPAASRGVIVIDTKSDDLLSTMGLSAEQIQNIDVLKLPAGTIGPNQLRVLVVQLKDGV